MGLALEIEFTNKISNYMAIATCKFSLLCMKNSYIINKTYEINELQYYMLYVHVHYHFVIRDGGPVALKISIVSTTHDSDVRTRPPDT
jgi:hypothetical protein